MPRKPRIISETGSYHIMIRGVNKQDLFHDDQDYRKFLKCLRQSLIKSESDLFAYCLMTNHIHLLLFSCEPDVFMKRLSSGYVYYYNHKYDRIGHLFQERYKSEAITDEAYLLTVFRYILHNPEKAGICPYANYAYSSVQELFFGNDLCRPDLVIDLAGGLDSLLDFLSTENEDICMDIDNISRRILDMEKAMKLTGLADLHLISKQPQDTRNQYIQLLSQAGISIHSISDLTQISRNTIRKILR